MLKKSFVQGLVIFVITAFPLNAASVSFLVIETGLSKNSANSRYSTMWENGLMDVFFETGHVVSNAPILRISRKPAEGFPSEAEKDFKEAKEGEIDYFIVAIVSHPAPHNVSLRLFRTNSQQMLFEHTYTDRTYKSTKEEYDTVKDTVGILAARVR